MYINGAVFHSSAHLDDEQLEKVSSKCPLCGGVTQYPLCVIQDDPQVLLLKCAVCNASSASRIPTTRALNEYYSTYYEASMSPPESGENITFNDSRRFAKHLTRRILQCGLGEKISILDFGGGDGSISYTTAMQLLSAGASEVKIMIVDYDNDLISSADRRISINKVSVLDDVNTLYDVVIASAVLEHLPRPKDVLLGLLDLLRTGGVFYARTPYSAPLIKAFGLVGIKWDFTYPAHIHDFGQDFWDAYFKEILCAADWEVLESRPSIVETTLKENFTRTVAAYFMKAPWYLLGRRYKWVGGWEVFVQKKTERRADLYCAR